MDLETENRLAALLVEETRWLRLQADKEGKAYLLKPRVRHRPNSRFLATTVLGIHQANRVVEVDEMWRFREKELDLETKLKSRTNGHTDSRCEKRNISSRSLRSVSKIEQNGRPRATSSSVRYSRSISYSDRENGLGDDELEEFLRSRVKRGRGTVGSRIDEAGLYHTAPSGRQDRFPSPDVRVKEERERRLLGPEKPLFLRSKSSDDEPSTPEHSDGEETKKNDGRSIVLNRRDRRSIVHNCMGRIVHDCRGWRTMGDR